MIGPSFAADEVPDVIEAVIDTYRGQRSAADERFIDTVKRVGLEPFKTAANAVRRGDGGARVSAAATMKFIDTNHDRWHDVDGDDAPVAAPAPSPTAC